MKCFFLLVSIFSLFSCATYNKDWDWLDVDSNKEKAKNLFEAVKSDDLSGVRKNISGRNVNVSDHLGQTALMWACWKGNLSIIEKLLNSPYINVSKSSGPKQPGFDVELDYNSLFCFVSSANINSGKGYSEEEDDENNKYKFGGRDFTKPIRQFRFLWAALFTGKGLKAEDWQLKNINYSNIKFTDYYSMIHDFENDRSKDLRPGKVLYDLIRRDPNVLASRDFFSENVIHKIIRSGRAEYFDIVLAALSRDDYIELNAVKGIGTRTDKKRESIKNKIRRKEYELLTAGNRFGDTPLLLAIEYQNVSMVKKLLDKGVLPDNGEIANGDEYTSKKSLLTLAFDDGAGNPDVFIELLVAKGNKVLKDRSENKKNNYNGKDDIFARYVNDFYRNPKTNEGAELAGLCRGAYETYLKHLEEDDITSMEILRDEIGFGEIKNELFNLVQNAADDNDITKIDLILRKYPYLAYSSSDNAGKTALHLAIENTNNQKVYNKVMQYAIKKLEKLEPAAVDFKDYLIIAIINNNRNVIKDLLHNPNPRYRKNERLMASHNDYTIGIPAIKSKVILENPLIIYFSNFNNEKISELDKEVVQFYKNRFEEGHDCSYLIERYIKLDISEDVFQYLFKTLKKGFDGVNKAYYLEEGERSLGEVLSTNDDFENRKRKLWLLKYYINNEAIYNTVDFEKIKQNLANRDDGEEGDEIVPEIRSLIEIKEATLKSQTLRRGKAL